MSALHIVSKSPFAHSALTDCLRACGSGTLLLIEDAVYATAIGNEWLTPLRNSQCKLFVLREDCAARGITADARIEAIDYAGFVLLCCRHTPIVSWY